MAMADRKTTIEAGVASPCNRICTVHPRVRLCVGCGRSLDEIAGWLAFRADERALVMAALPSRLALLRDADAPQPAA
jgi:predicted Fe-S protein YdhL (DUF1289 family)